MRIDRQLTTAVFHPLQRAGIAAAGFRLPILMFHSVSDDPESGVSPYFKTNTAPGVFRRQMAQLAGEGYKTIDLIEAVRMLSSAQHPPEKTVVITFDDGFGDFYIHAFPVLLEHGFTATMFLPTAFIADQRLSFKGADCLTWNEVRLMHARGIAFGSHTVNHPKLVELPLDRAAQELLESRAAIERELGGPVKAFAFPYAFPQADGSFAREFRGMLVNAGYACCVTTELGRVKMGDDPYRLKRLPVNSLDDEALLRAKLEGGYDWLGVPQYIVKKAKTWRNSQGKKRPVAPADAPPVQSKTRP